MKCIKCTNSTNTVLAFNILDKKGFVKCKKIREHWLKAEKSYVMIKTVLLLNKIYGKETRNVTYKEARVYLDKVSKYGSVLGLDTIRELLHELGDPQNQLKFIHIAGTNGKGSVLAYISSILTEAGYRTGRYVSPTVVSYLERISVDQSWIKEEAFADLVEQVKKATVRMEKNGKGSPTVFEMETAVAFLYFAQKNCDFVVLETGLGGRLDATNVVENTIAAVFTTISMDHMNVLGTTLEEIARNKAGIIKNQCCVVTSNQKRIVLEVLKETAKSMQSIVYEENDAKAILHQEGIDGQIISYEEYKELRIPLAGRCQIKNVVTALGVIKALEAKGYPIPQKAVYEGFKKTKWPGRFTCIDTEPVFIVDGAHNEDAALQLKETIQQYFKEKRLRFIMGVFKDKEFNKIAHIMGPLAEKIYTIDLPDTNRTLPAEELGQVLKNNCSCVENVGDMKKAVELAYQESAKEDVIVAFGSLSYLGKIIKFVEERKEV